MNCTKIPPKRSAIVGLLDEKAFRRAAFCAFLDRWASLNDVSMLCPSQSEELGGEPWAMGILNLGASSLADAEPRKWLRSIQASSLSVPIAVISDRYPGEAVAYAFREGVRGFIPSSTAPAIGLGALTLILNGGDYFPPPTQLQKAGRRPST